MWLNYAFHSKHLLFSQSPLLLVSHLQEDEFSVIIWNAEEFYTKMKLSMWGIVRDCSQQPSEEKLSLYGKTGRVFGFYFLIVHLSLFTLPMVLFTNPANESVLFTKAGVSIFILNSYLFLIMMTRPPWSGRKAIVERQMALNLGRKINFRKRTFGNWISENWVTGNWFS